MHPALESVSWPVRTERLSIRPATADDADAAWTYRRLEEVGRWITTWPRTVDRHRETFAAPERLAVTYLVEHDGAVVGDLMLRVGDAWSQSEVRDQAKAVQAELGWAFDPAYGGRGLATEAVVALIRLCFTELGLRRVTAECFAENEASWRLMERVGMRREAHTRLESLHRDGTWRDGMSYAVLADEWEPTASYGG